MRLCKILFLASVATVLASCSDNVRPECNDGHQLWFYSMDQDGMNLSEEKTTMLIAANEIREYWKGEQSVLFNVLETKDDILGPEGYRLVFGKDAVAVDAKGRVTAGSQIVEWGTAGQTTPSANLAVGGLFFMLVE